jgi:hypothetical protein
MIEFTDLKIFQIQYLFFYNLFLAFFLIFFSIFDSVNFERNHAKIT